MITVDFVELETIALPELKALTRLMCEQRDKAAGQARHGMASFYNSCLLALAAEADRRAGVFTDAEKQFYLDDDDDFEWTPEVDF